MLRSVPTAIRSEKMQKLQRHAEELEYLDSELQLAPTVAPASLEAAKRLVRIDEGNQAARATLQKMTQRCQAARAKSKQREIRRPVRASGPPAPTKHISAYPSMPTFSRCVFAAQRRRSKLACNSILASSLSPAAWHCRHSDGPRCRRI